MAYTTDDLWSQFAQQILKTAAPSFDPSQQQFSLASTTLSLGLDSTNTGVLNAEIFYLGNTIPAPGPSYAPGSTLVTSYQSFLDAIDLKGDSNPNLDQAINQAASGLTAAQNNLQSVQATAVQGWTAYKQINPTISFGDYVTNQYTTYVLAKEALDAATLKWQQLMTQKYGIGYAVIANARNHLSPSGGATDATMQNTYNMMVAAGAVVAAGTTPTLPGQTAPAPNSALINSFAPAFSLPGFDKTYGVWQNASVAGASAAPAASFHLTGHGASADWSAQGWSADTEGMFTYGFLSLWGSNQTSSSSESSFAATSGMDVQIDFVGLNSFPIVPGPWFDLGIVKTYRNQLLPSAPDFFDEMTGSLARLPAQAVIGFQPKVTLSLSNADYASFQSSFHTQTNAAVGFGPFVVGETSVSSYADKSSVQFDDNSSTITLSPPPTTTPVLLGVISSRLDV